MENGILRLFHTIILLSFINLIFFLNLELLFFLLLLLLLFFNRSRRRLCLRTLVLGCVLVVVALSLSIHSKVSGKKIKRIQ